MQDYEHPHGKGPAFSHRSVVRFLILGGFLGTGKTTALVQLASIHRAVGKRVSILTNDQGEGLVDTRAFREQGLLTDEVAGGCFCCRFNEFIAAAGRLQDGHQPDVILAEPVGSCTDIVATVINPLRELYADQFTVAPYVVLIDPERAFAALSGTGRTGFSAKVTYIYKMQQHEADIVAINKVDTLSTERLAELKTLVERNFPKAKVVEISARTGEGFDRLMELLETDRLAENNVIDVDYDTYAEGEASLGWYNAAIDLNAPQAIDVDRFLLELTESIRQRLISLGVEPAHVKMIAQGDGKSAIANLVSSDSPPELSRAAGSAVRNPSLLINARVEADPEVLRRCIEETVVQVARNFAVVPTFRDVQSFSPPRPEPTHRVV